MTAMRAFSFGCFDVDVLAEYLVGLVFWPMAPVSWNDQRARDMISHAKPCS